jgi:asparagine synthetase B (glutamine-hydrolysing)
METSDLIFLNTGKLFSDTTVYDLPRSRPNTSYTPFNKMLFNDHPGMMNYYLFSTKFLTNVASIDRSNTLTTPFNLKLMPHLEMPVYEKVSYDYADLVDKRAKEILEKDKEIIIFYGGGIDSIAILTALSRAANRSKQRVPQIKIALSQDSIYADRYFFDEYIKHTYELLPSVSFHQFLGDNRFVCVTGEGNDELFGTNYTNRILYRRSIDTLEMDPTEEHILYLINTADKYGFRSDEDAERNLKYLFDVAKKSPVELTTVHQFFWWINFCLNWNTKQTRLLAFALLKVKPEENYFNFFSTKEFQLWSMNNVGSSWKKKEVKNYIALDELMNKSKVNNLNTICYNKKMAFALTSQLTKYQSVGDIDSSKFLIQDNSFL